MSTDILTTREVVALNALAVLVLTPATRHWLQANDPKALEQAIAALEPSEPDIHNLIERADRHEKRLHDPLLAKLDNDGFTCRLGVYHGFNDHDDEDCPHMRAHDDDYCSACAPYQCHHEHDHP